MLRAKQLFPWPLALAAALQGCLSPVVPIPPARAVLVSPAVQGGEAIPPGVMEWFIGAQQAYGEGEPAEALRLQRKVMEWLEATPSPSALPGEVVDQPRPLERRPRPPFGGPYRPFAGGSHLAVPGQRQRRGPPGFSQSAQQPGRKPQRPGPPRRGAVGRSRRGRPAT